MRFLQVLGSFLIMVLFFILATATSQEDDFGMLQELNLTIELADTSLTLTNSDTIDIQGAQISLFQEVPTNSNQIFFLNDYSLEKDGVDIIPYSDFVNDTLVFNQDSMPILFQLNMEIGVVQYFYTEEF